MEATSPATPIFVLGTPRSGTTWLANVLAGHSRVAGVQAEDHFGIHESIFFSHFARAFGDLTDDGELDRFLTAFETSDYYLLSGLEPDWLRTRRPRSYPDAFRTMMDEVAARQDADCWLEKSPPHVLEAEQLAVDFPDAWFVAIVRDPVAVTASHAALYAREGRGGGRVLRLARARLICEIHQRVLVRFSRHEPRSLLLDYEELLQDREPTVRQLCSFLGLPFEPAMLTTTWKRNTSYEGKRESEPTMSRAERAFIAALGAVLGVIPLPVLERLASGYLRRVRWPDWVWRRRDERTAA